jgi:serine/threonine protein kinase
VTDARSDLFSLGIVFYELLTGVNIFETEDVFETLERVKTEPIDPPRRMRADIPEDIDRIIMRCLQRPSRDRYANAGELGYDLEYHMYSGGYGPTIITLAQYVAKLFPEYTFYAPPSRGDATLDTSADTVFRKREARR